MLASARSSLQEDRAWGAAQKQRLAAAQAALEGAFAGITAGR
jgi:hypothetical protein